VVLGVAIVGVTTGTIWELSRWGKRGVRKEKSEVEGVLEGGLRDVVDDKNSGQVWNWC
jgi:high-affinity Fe2+/Pb2+ permease